MKKLLIVALLSCAALSACGVKGALYFPETQAQSAS